MYILYYSVYNIPHVLYPILRDCGQNGFNINAIIDIKINVNKWIGGLAAGQNVISERTDLDLDGMFIDWRICADDQYQSQCRTILSIWHKHGALKKCVYVFFSSVRYHRILCFSIPVISTCLWIECQRTYEDACGVYAILTIDFVDYKHLEAEVVFTTRRMSWSFHIIFFSFDSNKKIYL